MMRELTEDECAEFMNAGTFEALISGAAMLILTQSWCPQWDMLKESLPDVEAARPDANIFYVEYDIADWRRLSRDEFRTFKETVLKNREIPYVQYYKDGALLDDHNYAPTSRIMACMPKAVP
jgi:hypothetical protein